MTIPQTCAHCGQVGSRRAQVRLTDGDPACTTCVPTVPRSKTCNVCGDVGTRHRPVFLANGVDAHKECRPIRACAIPSCPNASHALGLCSHHYNKDYYLRDPDWHRSRARAWANTNPDKRAAIQARRDPEKARESSRRWYWSHRLAAIASQSNAKALRLGISGLLTAQGIAARIEYFGDCCWVCGGEGGTIDHVIPLGVGGPNLHANIRPACQSCNSRRSWLGRRAA